MPVRRSGTFVLAAATLTLETALTRVFALSQGHHFSFMAISIGLLGLGAGGTWLTLWPQIVPGLSQERFREPDRALALVALGFAATTLGGYVTVNVVPFDMYRIAWQGVQILYLMIDYLALTLPFFCSGLAIGLALRTAKAGRELYAANLLGSACGCLIALGALTWLGASGTVVLSAAAGCVAAGLYAWERSRRRIGQRTAVLACGLGALVLSGVAWVRPAWLEVRLSPYRALSYALQYPGARVLSSRWNAFSRVDIVESEAIHVSPGLSLGYLGQVPLQRGLYVDAHAQAPILSAGPNEVAGWVDHLPLSLAYRLRPQADVLVLEPGGGLDVAAALSQGAEHVTAVASNPLEIDAVRRYGSGLYADPKVQVIPQSPRSYVRGERGPDGARYAVIDLALNDAQRTAVSGGYALAEETRYTVQAFVDFLSLLEPGGVLVVQRWLQTPPSESLRAWGIAAAALRESGDGRPEDSLVAIRSWSTMLIVAKKGAFLASELDIVRRFCAERQFDLVYLPDLRPEEANRYNVHEGAPYYRAYRDLLPADRQVEFYRAQAYDVRPPTDDWPFFHHLFRWRQMPEVLQALGHTWQPFGGGGYLVLLALLGIATLTSTALIVLPSAFARRLPGKTSGVSRGRILAYCGCLGVAYLAVEIPLIQRFVLFLDHPTTAFAIVVSVLLAASGVGSTLAGRLRARWAIPLLVAYVLALSAALPAVSDAFLGRTLAIRILVATALLAPLGLLMGTPFPAALGLLGERAPGLIPWAWGINGCTSVIVSILAALIALNWGFSAVLLLATSAYLLAWRLWMTIDRPRPESRARKRISVQ